MTIFLCALFCAKGLALGVWFGYRRGYANGVRDEAREKEFDDRLRDIFDAPDENRAAFVEAMTDDRTGLLALPPNYNGAA